jgi:hypothetical protein
MSKPEAIQMARRTLRKLGIPLKSVFAEQEPGVGGPHKIGTNTVPYYYVAWPDPRGSSSVEIEINGEARRVERIMLRNESLHRPLPHVAVVPPRDPSFPRWPQVNPEYARQLIPIVLRGIDEYGQKLSLPVPRPLTTNHLARFHLDDNLGWPHCEVELTNGWRFVFRNSMVNGFEAPDRLFSNRRPILIKDFTGKWNMTEQEAVELVKRTIAKLNYPTNRVHFEVEPQVNRPAVSGIPRYMFYWYYNQQDDLQSTVWAEVDAGRRELKSLYYDDKAYWNHPPPIGVPISLPPKTETNTVSANSLKTTPDIQKPPPRPFKHPPQEPR